ncbi:baseplate J/gp47 family protein, partial [Hydrogenimonas sp.]
MRPPKVTTHDIETIKERIRRTGSLFLPEWRPEEGEPGWSVAQLYARMHESLGDEADEVPRKLFVAYLDALGFSQRPARAATAPVVFEPAPKFRGSVTIPKGTALESEAKVRYETDRDITVTSAKLTAFLEADPERNEVTDHTRKVLDAEKIGFFEGGEPAPQYLYFGDDDLFRIHRFRGDPDAYLKITVPLNDAAEWSYWGAKEGSETAEWLPFVWHGSRLNKEGNTRTIRREIGGVESYWIRAKLTGPVAPLNDYAVTFRSRTGVDALYYNDVAIDPTRTIYPFGRLPQRNDTFYIAASEALSKRGATVGIDFGGQEMVLQADGTLDVDGGIVSFEYFNGSSWKPLPVERYDAAHPWAERECDLSFRVPWDLKESSVNGDKNLWIRCRLVGGHYTCTEGSAGVTFTPPTFTSVDLYVKEFRRRPSHLLRQAHGNVEDLLEGGARWLSPLLPLYPVGSGIVKEAFTPPIALSERPGGKRAVEEVGATLRLRMPESLVLPYFRLFGFGKWRHPYAQLSDEKALYLGFDRPFPEGAVSILWVAEERSGSQRIVEWSYSSDGGSWRRLPLQDGTEGCSKRGYLLFIAPQDQRKRRLFGKELYWLKALFPPETKGVGLEGFYLNAVSVTQCQSVEREIVGSGDGTASQRFTVANTPAFDLRVEVLESQAPEGLPFREDPFSDGVWVLWERVEDLQSCGADARCYRFDPDRGEILFGDGTHGRIPPIGRNSIAASYRFGGGREGNCPAGAIKKAVDSLAHIQKLFNPLPAEGGAEREPLASLMRRAPLRMKHRGRAVRREDYEALAMEASGDVAKVAVDTGPGRVDLYLLPRSAESRPTPDETLIRNVTEAVAARAAATAAVGVHPPLYVPAGVELELLVDGGGGAARRREEGRQRLERYFHPLHG